MEDIMLALRQIVVVGALFAGLGVTGSAVAGNQPPWETHPCESKEGWKTFTPKSEGNLPACHTVREWRVCDLDGRKPLYAYWCPAKVGVGKHPSGFAR